MENVFHRAWKMAQLVTCLLRKNEDPCFDPNYPYKKNEKTDAGTCACDLTTGDLEQGGSLGLSSQLVLQSGLLQAQQETMLKKQCGRAVEKDAPS